MLRENAPIFTNLHKVLDLGLTAAAFTAAYYIKRNVLPDPIAGLSTEPSYYIVLFLIIIVWAVALSSFNVYATLRPLTLEQVLWNLCKAVLVAFLSLVVALYVLKITDVSRLLLGIFLLLDLVFLVISKTALYRLLRYYRRQGYNIRNVLVIGSYQRAREAINRINQNPETGCRVMGCLDLDPAQIGEQVAPGIKIIGTVAELPQILKEKVVDELVFAMPLKKIKDVENYFYSAELMGVNIRILPDWQVDSIVLDSSLSRVSLEEFMGMFTMTLSSTPCRSLEISLKNVFDYFVAGIGLMLLAPVFVVVAVAIKIASPGGPVFFRQVRCGENGRRFKAFKFRTMVPNAEDLRDQLSAINEMDGPVFKVKHDPRIIPVVGALLRKTSLDELPQLINVLKGEMSLIGPRPPIPAEVEKYEAWQRRRLSMKPGITGLWQVQPNRNNLSFQQWMELDLAYIDNWSLALDAKIVLRTFVVMLMGMGR